MGYLQKDLAALITLQCTVRFSFGIKTIFVGSGTIFQYEVWFQVHTEHEITI